jgi:glycosyltransferase involved in cell wall biosynthesis
MKIFFYSYPWGFQKKGGGEIQLLKTKEYLEKIGVEVKLFNQWEDKLEECNILHIFGSVKDCLGLIKIAKRLKVKVCLSSIFWTDIRRFMGEVGIKNKINAFSHHITKAIVPFVCSERGKLFKLADLILPNSASEAYQIKRYFFIKKNNFFIVPNGVDERFQYANADEFVKKYNLKEFILYVGRIEPRKNQLGFIRAMRGFKKFPIVFVGDYTLEHKYYYEICQKEKASNMYFLGYIEHESSLFASMYAAAKIFCLTSWFETPGLAALEAALAGKNIVITPYGSTKDYFKEWAFYARPYRYKEIRENIERAIDTPFNEMMRKYILENFLWSKVAEKTLEGYKILLEDN